MSMTSTLNCQRRMNIGGKRIDQSNERIASPHLKIDRHSCLGFDDPADLHPYLWEKIPRERGEFEYRRSWGNSQFGTLTKKIPSKRNCASAKWGYPKSRPWEMGFRQASTRRWLSLSSRGQPWECHSCSFQSILPRACTEEYQQTGMTEWQRWFCS